MQQFQVTVFVIPKTVFCLNLEYLSYRALKALVNQDTNSKMVDDKKKELSILATSCQASRSGKVVTMNELADKLDKVRSVMNTGTLTCPADSLPKAMI